MRYGAEHKQETRTRLLKAAANSIRAEGPHQAGVSMIMAEAGLTHGGFYAHFASKDELITAAIEQMFEQSRSCFVAKTQDRDPADALWSYISFYLSSSHRDGLATGCPIAALLSDAQRVSGAARESLSQGASRLKKQLADLLRGMEYVDAEDQADSLLAEMVGALMLARAEPDRNRSNKILLRSKVNLKKRFHLESV
ncbi:TetR/AcrR family transcriptional regulator [Paraburkholderia caribensis]|uniref:TetR/AcrR family transcriptional regulator n=1 Tax=Paraburkholderia caribensis TaxID=75105 RepID=UPI001CB36BE0|nr:TetR/AcrR family transcriptional regulator [Paraburkholderia caribensis]CAG9249559.1 TetR family transcriptional regulator [Paraburkholderia caribensis]